MHANTLVSNSCLQLCYSSGCSGLLPVPPTVHPYLRCKYTIPTHQTDTLVTMAALQANSIRECPSPASSQHSRTAAPANVSPGSTPPPGTQNPAPAQTVHTNSTGSTATRHSAVARGPVHIGQDFTKAEQSKVRHQHRAVQTSSTGSAMTYHDALARGPVCDVVSGAVRTSQTTLMLLKAESVGCTIQHSCTLHREST
jgi:hypothetical protein